MPIEACFKLEKFVEKCPSNLSGADFYALTNRARQHALKRLIRTSQTETIKTIKNTSSCLTVEDFDQSLIDFQPTLSEKAFLEYEKYFEKYSGTIKK